MDKKHVGNYDDFLNEQNRNNAQNELLKHIFDNTIRTEAAVSVLTSYVEKLLIDNNQTTNQINDIKKQIEEEIKAKYDEKISSYLNYPSKHFSSEFQKQIVLIIE